MNWNSFYFNAGAGKSTLLNLLVGRETKGIDMKSGTIKINGEKASKLLRRKIGYVLQEDIFFSNLTVRQSLEVSFSQSYSCIQHPNLGVK